MSDQEQWPNPPEEPDHGKSKFTRKMYELLYQAQLDVYKAKMLAMVESDAATPPAESEEPDFFSKAKWESEHSINEMVHGAYVEVAKGQIDRSIQRAEFIQKMASAISALYIAILGVSFSVAKDVATGVVPVPKTALVPTFFLALAIFLATVYLSYLTDSDEDDTLPSKDGSLESKQNRRRDIFINWNRNSVLRLKHFMQAAVLSLGFGVMFLPLPYIDISEHLHWFWRASGIALGIICIPLVVEAIIRLKAKLSKESK